MSLYAMERILWEMVNDQDRISQFRADPNAYLGHYPLTEKEKRWLLNLDYASLERHGVNQRLVFAARLALEGPDKVFRETESTAL